MSEYCFSPAIGELVAPRAKNSYDPYTPGDIRLYGRPAPSMIPLSVSAKKFEEFLALLKAFPAEGIGKITAKVLDEMRKILGAILKDRMRSASELVTFRVSSSGAGLGKGGADDPIDYSLSVSDPETAKQKKERTLRSIGVIYGYAYEGHCYKLPKPQIMILPAEPAPIVDGECGYTQSLGYAVWQIDKLARVVILDVRTDDLKTLVLDENTPGNRSPLAYSQNQALARSEPTATDRATVDFGGFGNSEAG